MGLFSKLLGNAAAAGAEKAAKDLLNGLLGAQNGAQNGQPAPQTTSQPASAPVPGSAASTAPSGDSWGDHMPGEENQYNFSGTFTQYFESIFASDFAAYRVEKSFLGGNRRVIYTFYADASKALVVELMPESCSAYKLRRDCQKEQVPYRRFYYNHEGWWNTRTYVVNRLRAALNG